MWNTRVHDVEHATPNRSVKPGDAHVITSLQISTSERR